MDIKNIIESKKKWRAHIARVKALPKDYQIVYKEIQKYLFKVGPTELMDGGIELLSEIIDLFEEGARLGKGVLEITGRDVASFCDDLIKDSKTYSDIIQEFVGREVNDAVNKSIKKTTDKKVKGGDSNGKNNRS